ncbi:alcohol dehydrogenase catalytic domain-containing protein [Altererythrobacter indicus]|uniref:Alcohol dehydrogenase catalytic domain-containing protein n=1 Tax=Altericroceibacterium indicum TaxID=374177 RepID=A0A845A8S7_9SPHN|nr:NAD(P)-dependent alcohol dehydrogenase [Altericroceibacterium indicum]MXP24966.1 alcohol dehydrogenase catalytic domain-containing protein [Altericroceibacterium indicum]
MHITAAVSRPGEPFPKIEQVEQSEPGRGEMRIRIHAVGICHTDLHEHPGRHAPHPIVLGHEGAGIVETLGEGVNGFAVGDHVVLSGSSCGHCPSCLANRPTYCDLAMPLCFGGKRLEGSTALCADGEVLHSHFFGQSSFASHAIVPERTAVKVPKGLPLELLAPLGCGIITGAGAVIEALQLGFGQSLAVFGVGGVGLSAIMAARLVGAQHIVAVDINPERLELARSLGATHTVLATGDDTVQQIRQITGRGVEFTLNTTNAEAVHSIALEVLAMNGTAGFVAAPLGPWNAPMFPMLAGGKQLRGILGGDAAPRLFLPKLIDYWQQGRFPFDRLIKTYPFGEIATAFHDVEEGHVIKPVLILPQGGAT